MNPVDRTDSTFTKRELARLMVYRAAVAAGFYTDWDGSGDATDAPADVEGQAPTEAAATPPAPAR